MASFKIPYLLWRDGRPRWLPGPRLRPHWKGRDLKDAAGNWLGLEAAIAAARELNRQVAEWKGGRQALPSPRPPVRVYRSCADLLDAYWASADFRQLAPYTQKDYRRKAEAFLFTRLDGALLAEAPARAISKTVAFNFWEEAERMRGLHMANGIKAAVSPAFSYGERKGWLPPNSNPWLKMDRPAAKPRLAIWLPPQVNAFIAAARPDEQSVADAFVIALHTGQRLADVLAMPARIFSSDRICLSQLKMQGRALIDLKMTAEVRMRVAAIRARWQEQGIIGRQSLLINERTGQRYDPSNFNKRFRPVRAAAAKMLPVVTLDGGWSGPKIFELAELRFQDLRDTCVTRLALAGCSIAEIAAVTGHTLTSITAIMKHYLALNRAMADSAVDRLEAWFKQEGIAV